MECTSRRTPVLSWNESPKDTRSSSPTSKDTSTPHAGKPGRALLKSSCSGQFLRHAHMSSKGMNDPGRSLLESNYSGEPVRHARVFHRMCERIVRIVHPFGRHDERVVRVALSSFLPEEESGQAKAGQWEACSIPLDVGGRNLRIFWRLVHGQTWMRKIFFF